MAQMQMFKEIEYMSLSTSKYFRYIFQSGDNVVRLEDEIEHVRIYLEIQKHRYRDAFSYHIDFEEELTGLTIPPLVLQTFIENAVKYAVSGIKSANSIGREPANGRGETFYGHPDIRYWTRVSRRSIGNIGRGQTA